MFERSRNAQATEGRACDLLQLASAAGLPVAALIGRRPRRARSSTPSRQRSSCSAASTTRACRASPRSTTAGNWTGLDIDLCRAVAAAVFGDPMKVKYTPLAAKERFTALQSGEVDILSRNTTWTLARDTALGLDFVGVNYYDGQGFMVDEGAGRRAARMELDGASVCVQAGTTTELNLADYFRANNMKYEPVVFENNDEVIAAFRAGRCDVFTTDQSGLYSSRTKLENPDDHVVLPEIISKEPLGPAVRQGDNEWADVVRWSLLRHGRGRGARGHQRQCRPDEGRDQNPDIQRLLGTEGEQGKALGLPNDFAYQVDQAGRQLRRELRAQCRHEHAAEDRARPERPVEQGRPAVRAALPLSASSDRRAAAAPAAALVEAPRATIRAGRSKVASQARAARGTAARLLQRPQDARRCSTRSSSSGWCCSAAALSGQQHAGQPAALGVAIGLRLPRRARRLRHLADADRLQRRHRHASAAPSSSACSTRSTSPWSASSWRRSSASSWASPGCRATGSSARLAAGLRRGHPQHPAAAAAHLLVHGRAGCAAAAAQDSLSLSACSCSTSAACSCPSRCSATGLAVEFIAVLGGHRRAVLLLALGQGAARATGQRLPTAFWAVGHPDRPAACSSSWSRAAAALSIELPADRPLPGRRGGFVLLPEFLALVLGLVDLYRRASSPRSSAPASSAVSKGQMGGGGRSGPRRRQDAAPGRGPAGAAGDHPAARPASISTSPRTARSAWPSAIPTSSASPAPSTTRPARRSRSSPSPWRSICMLSLLISGFMNWYNARMALVER